MNGWRSPARVAANWKAVRTMARLYGFVLFVALALAVGGVWHVVGYWKGYADGVTAAARNEESSL